MAYTKTTWVDEVLAGAERFDIKDNVGNPLHTNVQIALATSVTTPGTSVDATNMNNIENGVDTISKGAARSVKGVAGGSAGDVADIAAGADNQVLRRVSGSLGFGSVPNAALVDHKELIYLKVLWHDEDWSVGDGKMYFTIPDYLAGNIVDFDISCIVASTSGLPTVQAANCGNNPGAAGTDILSTKATIDVNEFDSMHATTPPVIANATVVSGDFIRIDIDVAGTGTKGLDVFFVIEKTN